ncbi:hypothetical protein QF047_002124 [Arthrobacter sp. W4I7]|nr:hypothetical protein [Arthrobacter sp. W4I7]
MLCRHDRKGLRLSQALWKGSTLSAGNARTPIELKGRAVPLLPVCFDQFAVAQFLHAALAQLTTHTGVRNATER